MIYHVLPGDTVVNTFESAGIEGEVIVCRECLVDGDVSGETLKEFWDNRADFIAASHGEPRQKYFDDVARDLEKLLIPTHGDEINLWFENELYCSVNMWFCICLLAGSPAKIYRVSPPGGETDLPWAAFGSQTPEALVECYHDRQLFSVGDRKLGVELWQAYSTGDHGRLKRSSRIVSRCFGFLQEVCEAEIEKATRPSAVLSDIKDSGISEFADIFKEFSRRAGVYGYGDMQVKQILARL